MNKKTRNARRKHKKNVERVKARRRVERSKAKHAGGEGKEAQAV